MLFKTNPAPRSLPRLSGFGLIEAKGPESAAFLQAQTMNDVRALLPGQWHWNGWLNPKGRVIALFALLRSAEDAFLLVLPDHPAADLLPRLQRYVFRTKVKLALREDLACAADPDAHHAAAAAARDLAGGDQAQGWSLDFGGDGGERRLLLLPAEHDALAISDAAVDARWRSADLAHGLPRLGEAQREAWTPQMLSLERLKAFSLKKGCYPGQEIVARTHYLGQARRGLARLAASQPIVPGQITDAEGHVLGEPVCLDDGGREMLAVVNVDAMDLPLFAAAAALARRDLLGGLQRPL